MLFVPQSLGTDIGKGSLALGGNMDSALEQWIYIWYMECTL